VTWPESVAYVCSVCNGHAISLVGKPWTEERECRSCYEIPDLDRASSAGPEALPPQWGGDPEAGAESLPEETEKSGNPFFPAQPEEPTPSGRRSRESCGDRDRSATQRTRPGSPPATPAGSPVSRTVARRDSVESPDGDGDG
jgi:hypothetical protein